MNPKVFLEISIGNKDSYDRDVASFEATKAFFDEIRPQYGWNGLNIDALDDEAKETLKEAYILRFSSNDSNASRPPLLSPPQNIVAGRIEIELFSDIVPKASENFRCLCTGEKGKGKSSGKPLHYKNTKFHRCIKDFMFQGGDIVKQDGSSGDCIYPGGKFNDEKSGLKLKHDSPGVVSFANSGPNSNRSQFFITFGRNPKLDQSYVVCGKVVSGMDIVQQINDEACSEDGTPVVDVVISDCGALLTKG